MSKIASFKLKHIYFNSITTSPPKEGTILTERAKDRHNSFYTTIQLMTKAGTKALSQNISWSTGQYHPIKPLQETKVYSSCNQKQGAPQPTNNTWFSHTGTPIIHQTVNRCSAKYPTRFHIFKDTIPSQFCCLMPHLTDHLGIHEFNVPMMPPY